jgi:hypothetical protein
LEPVTPLRIGAHGRVFILCPSRLATGGPESLHLLGHELGRLGHDARMCYLPKREHPTPLAYRDYHIARADEVVDDPAHLLIVSEIWTQRLRPFARIQKAIWWLSVDNYLLAARRNPFDFTSERVIHLVASDYARRFLCERGVTSPLECSSYVHRRFVSAGNGPRAPRVLFNPKKPSPLLDAVRAAAPDLSFAAIEGLDREGLADLFGSSRVYVDFGPHPGKERLPREAALAGCCVVTGRRGSADGEVDVPIPSRYKFDDRGALGSALVADVANTLRACVSQYDERIGDFASYRDHVLAEKDRFERAVAAIFGERRRQGPENLAGA